ncbi:hypothetical protein ACIRRA_45890 [Nocardia sp. NPDC101769]|uniref:hypothetical protein n=1 Tax=Nocardia sp. NPDC101769 TaxID=3364333 RepID=UPI00380EACCD
MAELNPPTITSPDEQGMVLHVESVVLPVPGSPGEDISVRCVDGTTYVLPIELHTWAEQLVVTNMELFEAGEPFLLPGHIDFGVLNGGVYAEMIF